MTRPITTAPADTARAMHAAEMRGQDMQDDQDCTDCEGSGITHQTERYCTCAAGRELARYADDAPEQIWTAGGNYWPDPTFKRDKTHYTRTDLCITEAECQRRIDAAVAVEREACAAKLDEIEDGSYSLRVAALAAGDSTGAMVHGEAVATAREAAATIRARGQK